MPRRLPPPGCITATEAISRIGKSLYKYVEKGHLHPQGPPTLKHKFYLESEIASIEAQEQNAFEEKISNRKGETPAYFTQARPSDMQSLYSLSVRIFGSSTISAEKRAAWVEAVPRGNYLVKRPGTGEVVAYFYVQALTHSRIMQYLKECRGSTIRPDELLPIVPGEPLELIIAGIGRDRRADKQYVAAVLHGFTQDLVTWANEGIEIRRLYAYSETLDGIYLSFSMGMQLWKRPRYLEREGPFFTFVLDVETTDIPLLRPYKRALAEYKRSHGQEVTSPPASRQVEKKSFIMKDTASKPEGTISLQELSVQVSRSEGTLKGHLLKWDNAPAEYPHFEHVRIPIKARPGQYNRYFTPEQAANITAWIEANTKKRY